jgi:hypothetical protein
MAKKYEFKKVENNKYAFIMNAEDIVRTEVVSKDFAKKHYEELLKQRHDIMENISKMKREIENNKFDGDEQELERFIVLANAANKYNKYKDAVNNLKASEDMVSSINESIVNIENVITELKRVKK